MKWIEVSSSSWQSGHTASFQRPIILRCRLRSAWPVSNLTRILKSFFSRLEAKWTRPLSDVCLVWVDFLACRRWWWWCWCTVVRPASGVMLLYNRKKARYRKDGYCWKKRRDGKTTREDHMKLKVQGIECIYGCYVHSAILPTFHRRCYWLLQVSDVN